jgi:7,8-dihydropterin-6-yl-methyl-4-(beta-D-ribofuranosyl)aminobenzene 5'-phosphate synthase
MRAMVVVDNRKNGDIQGEWGLCIYIEYGDQKILLDVGASELFVENAKKLGISLKDIDMAVLSHAHYDHANGMEAFFQNNDKAKFYLRETCDENCYFKKWFITKYIGIPKHILAKYPDRIVFAKGDMKLCEGVYLIPHKTDGLSEIGKREKMYQRKGRKWVPDDFSHEQSLVFETQKGLVIFNSCSHGGAVNIINEVASTFPDKKVYALIGGFHLFNKPVSEVQALGKKIRDTGIAYVCTGHCTGGKAYAALQEELGDKLHQLQVGLVMEF